MRKLTIKVLVTIHALWTIAIWTSLPLVIFYNQYYKIAFILVAVTLAAQLLFWGCPLTEIESKLRGDQAYQEKTFMSHYLKSMFGVHISDRVINWITGIYLAVLLTVTILKFWL